MSEPTPPTAPQAPVPRRFERSRDDRILAGVCGGIADHFHLDPLLVRIGAVVLALIGGAGVVAYLLCVLLVPAAGEHDPLLRQAIDGRRRGAAAGLVGLTIAVWCLTTGGIGGFWGGGPFPGLLLLAVIVGVVVLVARRPEGEGLAPASSLASEPGAGAEDGEEPTLVAAPVDANAAPVAPARRGHGGRIAFGAVLAGVAAVGGALAIAGADLRVDELLALLLIAAGAVLVVAAPFGGARALIPVVAVLAVATGVSAAADLDLRGGVGERRYRPATVADLRSHYHLAAGQVVLDLRDLALPAGETRTGLDVGFGQVTIRLPRGAESEVHAHAAGGHLNVLGEQDDGFDAERTVRRSGRYPGLSGVRKVLRIDARVGFGEVRVVRADARIPGHSPWRSGTAGAGR